MPRRRPPARSLAAAPAGGGELVHFVPAPPVDADYERFAVTLLDVAAEVAQDEDTLKQAAIEAIDRGEPAAARNILERWRSEAPADIVASLRGAKRCG